MKVFPPSLTQWIPSCAKVYVTP